MSTALSSVPAILRSINRGDVPYLRALQAEERLIDFITMMWSAVEPSRPFVGGWVIDAIAEHLEAVTAGEISRLIINVSPGMMKSLATCVFWPSWEWGPRNKPATRYLCASYSSHLTERDNLRTAQLIQSPLYRANWGSRFSASESMVKLMTDKTGWKLATSVGGVGTGERADRVICLPFDGKILTDRGWLQIGEVVRDRLRVRVAGWSGSAVEWQQIEAYETNSAGQLVEIDYGAGRLRCTDDHPVWVDGRGYVPAGQVRPGDLVGVVTAGAQALRTVRNDLSGSTGAHEGSALLFEAMPCGVADREGADGQQPAVPDLREAGLSLAGASAAHPERPVLQPRMPWGGQSGCEQSRLSNRTCHAGLQAVREGVSGTPQDGGEAAVLLAPMPGAWLPASATPGADCLPRMRRAVQAARPGPPLLLDVLQECGALQGDFGAGQRAVRPRQRGIGLPAGLDQDLQGGDPSAGWQRLPGLPGDPGRARQAAVRAPHRLREGQPGAGEPDHGLPLVPWQDAWPAGEPGRMAFAAVLDVRRLDHVPDLTFNVRVSPHHNYFADGVLVHNCDDPNSVKNAESQTVRDSTNHWLREVMPTRLSDPKTSAIVLIQQRTHEEDATGTLLSDEGDYEHLMIPMEYDGRRYVTGIGWEDPRSITDIDPEAEDREWWRVRGELCFPERFPAWVVERDKRAMGSYAAEGQFQQAPSPRGGGIIRLDWWQQWGPSDPRGIKYPAFDLVVASYDGAHTTKTHNDPCALAVLGVFKDLYPNLKDDEDREIALRDGGQPPARQQLTGMPRVMLARAWSERLAINDAVRKVDETCRRLKVSILLVENKANGHDVVNELHRIFREKPYSVVLTDPRGSVAGRGGYDKVARAMSVVPLFEDGMVYAPRTDWAESVRQECAIFPRGKHDDQVDAVVNAIRWLRDNGALDREAEVLVAERDAAMAEDSRGRAEPLYRT